MKRRISTLIVFGIFISFSAQADNALLAKSELLLYPEECSYLIEITAKYQSKNVSYSIEGYKKGSDLQTIIWLSPSVNLNDVGMRQNRTLYFKPAAWHKANIMSYQAAFMESPFSWGDIIGSNLNHDYKVESIDTIMIGEKKVVRLNLLPKRDQLYARIVTSIEMKTGLTCEREYYTAGGQILKKATYSNYVFKDKRIEEFKVHVKHFFMECEGFANVLQIKERKVSPIYFDPQNIDRIRASKKKNNR